MKGIIFLKNIGLVFITLFTLSLQAQAANTTTTTTKASATLAAVCTISTQNVNFGQVVLPISAQTATSSMNVQCTKGSSYTIGLAYGGVYGLGSTASGDYWVNQGCWVNCNPGHSNVYYEYNAQGQSIGSYIGTKQPANPANPAYTYGKMIGVAYGDSIAYSIQVPNQPAQVWNAGESSYTSTGTGSNQSIPVVATLQPSQTTNLYPTADSYLDTVTATVSY